MQLPTAITAAVNRHYPGSRIAQSEKLTRDKTTQDEVVVLQNGKRFGMSVKPNGDIAE